VANWPALNLNLPGKVGSMLAAILAVAIPVTLGITNAPELRAQTESVPKFEVASVRPSPPLHLPLVAPVKMGMFIEGGRVDIRLMSLRDLIIVAYRVKPFQLASTPDWMTTEVFDIAATIPAGVSKARVPDMLQALLAERFGSRFGAKTRNCRCTR
jgi:uncharacterized protein DUF3738